MFPVVRDAPVAIAPFEPQECVAPELFWVLSIEVIPAPGDADAVTLAVDAAGEVVLNPVGKVHCARVRPHIPLPALVEATVKLDVAVSPVLLPLTIRGPVVLI